MHVCCSENSEQPGSETSEVQQSLAMLESEVQYCPQHRVTIRRQKSSAGIRR